MPQRIEIIEDNEVVREGLCLLINSVSEHTIVGAYECCEEAFKHLERDDPDIILMDLDLPGMSGIQGIERVKKLRPQIEILVITVHEDSDLVFEALCAGASGYITKSANHARLLDAIEEVRSGGAPMSTKIARMVVGSFQRNHDSPLTPRETEVLTLLAKGKSYSVIAEELFVHRETVKSHIKNIYFKLQVHCKADALEKARKNRLI